MNRSRPLEHLKLICFGVSGSCIAIKFASAGMGAASWPFYPVRYAVELVASVVFAVFIAAVIVRYRMAPIVAVLVVGCSITFVIMHALSTSEHDRDVGSAMFAPNHPIRTLVTPLGDALAYAGLTVIIYFYLVASERTAALLHQQQDAARVLDELRRSEARYRAMVESQSDLICRFLPDTTLTFVNDAYCRFFGKRREELIGHSFLELLPEEARAAALNHIASLAEHPCTVTDEHEVLLPDGRRAWQQWVNHAIRDAQGRVVEFQGVGRDVTDRKLAEKEARKARDELESRVVERTAELSAANRKLQQEIAERRQAERALRESERRLRVLTDALPVCISYNDLQQRYQFNSRAYEDWFGLPREAIAGMRLHELVGAEAHRRMQPYIDQVLQGQTVEYEAELPLQWAGTRHVLVTLVPDFAQPGVVQGYYSLLHDVSDRRRAEERLRQHQAELAHVSRLSTMGQLVAGITHEINQPLYAISNYATACESALEKDASECLPRLRGWVDEIIKEVARTHQLIRRLRDFVRRTETHRSATELNALVRESIELIAFEARRHQVGVEQELASEPLEVVVDRIQIQQVVVNLLHNAFESLCSTQERDRRIVVRTALCGDRGQAEVAVEDNGPGFDATNVDKLFRPFYTTKPGGLGMGLAISRSIVETHRGRIWAEPRPDGGARFCFILPCRSETERHDV